MGSNDENSYLYRGADMKYEVENHVTSGQKQSSCDICGSRALLSADRYCESCINNSCECVCCGEIYIPDFDYDEHNICPDCNRYYRFYKKIVTELNALRYDILSCMRRAKQGSDPQDTRKRLKEVFIEIVRIKYIADRQEDNNA